MVNFRDTYFPWTLALPEDFFSYSRYMASNENLPGQCPPRRKRGRGRKREKTDLFKSGRKNPLGISDLLRVQLDVSKRTTSGRAMAGSGKNYALIDSRRSAVEGCAKVSLHLDEDYRSILIFLVRYGFVNWSNGRSFVSSPPFSPITVD